MILSPIPGFYLISYDNGSPGTAQAIVQWANSLEGTTIKIEPSDYELIIARVQQLYLIPQPDGRATAMAQVRLTTEDGMEFC